MVSPSSVPNPWYQISPSYDTAATGLEVEIVRLQNSVVDIQQYTGLRSKVKVVPCQFLALRKQPNKLVACQSVSPFAHLKNAT